MRLLSVMRLALGRGNLLVAFLVAATGCSLDRWRVDRKLREIPEVANVRVVDVGEFSTFIVAIVDNTDGCQLAFYGVRDDYFQRETTIRVTHVGQWGLACFYPESAESFVFSANIAEGPRSHAKGLWSCPVFVDSFRSVVQCSGRRSPDDGEVATKVRA